MLQPFEDPCTIRLIRQWMKYPHRFSSSFLDHIRILSLLLQLCEGNYCAAMLLDGFYEDEKRMDEQVRGWGIDPNDEDQWTGQVMEEIFPRAGHFFTREEIQNALSLLERKRYIDIRFDLDRDLDIEAFRTLLHTSFIDDTLNILIGNTLTQKPPQVEITLEPHRMKSPAIEEPEQSRRKEAKKVAFHLARARVLGLPATLTLPQWLETLKNFQWKCAYCSIKPYEIFEHFLPLFHGGGTTKDNCVPACPSCNSQKRDMHPLAVNERMREAVERVSHYLGNISDSGN